MITTSCPKAPEANPVTGWKTASLFGTGRDSDWFWKMIDRGIYLPCSLYEAFRVSAASTTADIESTIAAAQQPLGCEN